METVEQPVTPTARSRWLALAVNTGAAVAAVQLLFVLFTVVQGLSLREQADNFPGDVLHRIGIAFSTGVNIPTGLALLVAVALVSAPALLPGAGGRQRGLRAAALAVVGVVATLVAAGTILGVRASLHAARVRTGGVAPYQRWELVAYLTGTLGTALVAFLAALAAMPTRRTAG